MGGACSTNVERIKACGLFMGNPEKERPLGKQTIWWVDDIKMYLGGIRYAGT
jgi:hypothetical protein